MTFARPHSRAGFTLVEVLIGSTLAATILLAVISSYLFLGRNLSRLANLETLEAQSRRTLMYFAQDVRMTVSIAAPTGPDTLDNKVILTVPTNSGTTTVTYTYDSSAQTLTRAPATGSAQVLLTNLVSFDFNYYDSTNTLVTDYTNKILSMKQVAMTFSSQVGSSVNGTQTPLNQVASSRLIIRNKALLQ
jgi:type II secretory pathway component PulJ